jgi:uncharacterized protein (TIGR02145 family)
MKLLYIPSLLIIVLMTNCDRSKKSGLNNLNQKNHKEIKIDNQIWMIENLNEDKFQNGDIIQYAQSREEWIKAGKEKKPAWCYYNNDYKNGAKYGKLYNWYAVSDTRGLAPYGWHIPSEKEWIKLIEFLGGEDIAGTKLKSKTGWKEENGTDNYGFKALPGGVRVENEMNINNGYQDLGGFWWSSTGANEIAISVSMNDFYGNASKSILDMPNGLSVRCIKD